MMKRAVGQFICSNAATLTILDRQTHDLKFVKKIDAPLQTPLPKGIQNDPPGAVGRITGPLNGSLPEITGVTAKGTLRNPALTGSIKRNPHVFKLVNGPWCITGENLDGILGARCGRDLIILGGEMIVEQVWGYDGRGDKELVRGLVRRLRAKIEPEPHEPRYILTVSGVGYCFANEN